MRTISARSCRLRETESPPAALSGWSNRSIACTSPERSTASLAPPLIIDIRLTLDSKTCDGRAAVQPFPRRLSAAGPADGQFTGSGIGPWEANTHLGEL